jgi:hypothetical protein
MNKRTNYPKYLYHYTNLSTLALILDSKQIKFNRLDSLDDLAEGVTKDVANIRQYYFVSSWTCNENEDLAFWNMYTTNMKGVRIRLPTFPFKFYDKKTNELEYINEEEIDPNEVIPFHMTDDILAVKDRIMLYFDLKNNFLYPIEYVKDDSSIKVDYFDSKMYIGMSPSKIGKKKLVFV